ncbi:MAG TPA: DUF2164 domain-containing protein [Candidatus Acetothermia bacterium]|nr:DUF2164 domain-containing protein [Candidatus Acetothermia bacterium]
MAIKLSKDTEQRLITSIKRFFAEVMDQEIGDLKSSLFLKYALQEIGPCIYNKAVNDAQSSMQSMVSEIDSTCYEPELGYWKK